MQLVDCFIELIAYVSYLIKALPEQQPPYQRVKSEIDELIRKSKECGVSQQFESSDYELASFGVFAWIDESILNSEWEHKLQWQGEQLQRLHFQTADAGELFFDKLNDLQPHQLQVREVYYLCLAMGFTGRYCNPGDDFLLNQLSLSNLKLLEAGGTNVSELVDKKLFPLGYGDGSTPRLKGGRRFFSLVTIVGAGGPVILFFLLFLIYRFVLSNVGEDLLRSIR